MAKLSAWAVTAVGVLWVAFMLGWAPSPAEAGSWASWVVGLAFLAMGVGKLMRNYGKRR
ncbi:MAG: hypothetical protein U1B79_01540 [Candidatus Pacearchaeota archaeon]|nr:hypothetical protein [Nanoarchaeota archaeon]MDZ4226773.1 hypothetical protein [Candidatus Pacearchaeota archaeon]